MDMARGFAGFVLGLVVMGAVFFTGALDGASHWWARNVLHRADTNYDYDPEHSRYTVSTIYEPADNGQPSCEPRYTFVNHTTRVVKFLPDGYDDSYGNQSGYNNSGSGYVSMTPGQANVIPPSKPGSHGDNARDYWQSNDDRQGYGPPPSGQQGYDQQSYGGGQDYADQGYDSGREYDGSSHDDRYDGDDPGEANNVGECSAGVVKIILDRKK